MISSEGGLSFVEGKCPSKRNFDSTGAAWYSPLYGQLGINAAKQWIDRLPSLWLAIGLAIGYRSM